jgi:5'-nucleotidase
MGLTRRKFVFQASALAGSMLVSNSLLASVSNKKSRKLIILHTNDTHSNIDPFPANHAKFPNMGGVSRRDAYIRKIRTENEHVLVLDSGDIFQGTPYFNRYKGTLELKLMSEMGYDAATMGNHDFDAGLDGFLHALPHANFPFLCANYDFSETILAGKTQKNRIFQRGSWKIGVFGIGVELEGLVPNDKFGATKYLDPIVTANQQAEELKKQGCNLIICLSHLGLEYDSDKVSDMVLAEKSSGIQLILGGHTHSLLPQPRYVKNASGQLVLINQTGWAGLHIGHLELELDQHPFAKQTLIRHTVVLDG